MNRMPGNLCQGRGRSHKGLSEGLGAQRIPGRGGGGQLHVGPMQKGAPAAAGKDMADSGSAQERKKGPPALFRGHGFAVSNHPLLKEDISPLSVKPRKAIPG